MLACPVLHLHAIYGYSVPAGGMNELDLSGQEGRTAYLKGWDERHAYSICLTEADRAGMARMAFRTVDPEDLDYYERRLKEFAVKFDVISADYRRGTGASVHGALRAHR